MKINFQELRKKTQEAAEALRQNIPTTKESVATALRKAQDSATSVGQALAEKAQEATEGIRENMPATRDVAALALRKVQDSAISSTKALAERTEHAIRTAMEDERTKHYVESIESGIDATRKIIGDASERVACSITGVMDRKPQDLNGVNEESKLKKTIQALGGRDKIGLSGEVLTAAGSVAAGVAASGAIAGAAGATTLAGSTTLASIFGGIFVTTTPVGWVIGSAVIAGAAGYGLAKMIKSGSHQDHIRKEIIERLQERLRQFQLTREKKSTAKELTQLLLVSVAADVMSEEQAKKVIDLVERGMLDQDMALKRVKDMALASGIIDEAPVSISTAT